MKCVVILESTTTGFSSYSPDLPGCAATGRTQEEIETNMREALELHIEGLREVGNDIPEQQTDSSLIEVAA
ncbi:MAG: type II toxin-antitoxin system HicB family antitoxin [Bacteroidetes bacterium]|nr:type II toxin-antitoxin system HicB family antitoxin [Bacteroidota bacterium]